MFFIIGFTPKKFATLIPRHPKSIKTPQILVKLFKFEFYGTLCLKQTIFEPKVPQLDIFSCFTKKGTISLCVLHLPVTPSMLLSLVLNECPIQNYSLQQTNKYTVQIKFQEGVP